MTLQFTDSERMFSPDEPEYDDPPVTELGQHARRFIDAIFGDGASDALELTQEHAGPLLSALDAVNPGMMDSKVNQARLLGLFADESYEEIAMITGAQNEKSVSASLYNLRYKVTGRDDYSAESAFRKLSDEMAAFEEQPYEQQATARELLTLLIDENPDAVLVQGSKTGHEPRGSRRAHSTGLLDRPVSQPAHPRGLIMSTYEGFDGRIYTPERARKHAANVQRLAEKVMSRTGKSQPVADYKKSSLIHAEHYVGYEDIRVSINDIKWLGAAAIAFSVSRPGWTE